MSFGTYKVLRPVDINLVLPVIINAIPKTGPNSREKIKAMVDGVEVKVSSLRLRCFALYGITCSACLLQATHFNIEANTGDQWHLNLYAGDILFTHDHTLARSAFGKDVIENVTTMCSPCNHKKSLIEVRNLK